MCELVPNEHTGLSRPSPTVGSLLIAPAESGPRAGDVLCVFDEEASEPGAVFALVLNQPLDRPAQPLAFALFDTNDACAWWGGPTHEAFAIIELPRRTGRDDSFRPDGTPRLYVTERSGVWIPGRDHAPSAPARTRVFLGSIWLSLEQLDLYPRKGHVLTATDDWLFDPEPTTLAERLREEAKVNANNRLSHTPSGQARSRCAQRV